MDFLYTKVLLVFILSFQLADCVREELLTFDTTSPKGFSPSAVQIIDKDGKGVEPTVTSSGNQILVRTKTMPDSSDVDAHTYKENNFVYFPFIANPTDTEMIEMRYNFSHLGSCPPYASSSASVQCYNNITLLLVATTSNQPINSIDLSDAFYATNLSSSTTADKSRREDISVPPGTQGYRLVLHDQGSEFVLKNLAISRNLCQYTQASHELPLMCPLTPWTNQRIIHVKCNCTDPNSKPNSALTFIYKECKYQNDVASYREAYHDPNSVCECKKGSDHRMATNGTAYCKVRPVTLTLNPPIKSTRNNPQKRPTPSPAVRPITSTLKLPIKSRRNNPRKRPAPSSAGDKTADPKITSLANVARMHKTILSLTLLTMGLLH